MFNMNHEIFFSLILFAIFYNQYNFTMALVGPNVRSAKENEFPFVVSIMRVRNSTPARIEITHRCTGTLVSKQDVLTAEHCLRNALTATFKVMIGSVDLARSTPYYPLFCLSYEQWALNKQIQMKYPDNDIGFVKIIGNVPDYIPFAPLGYAPSNTLYGLDVVTAGCGKQQNNTTPRILQTVALKILTKNECEKKICKTAGEKFDLKETRLCTVGNPEAYLYKGDSGGPLLFYGSLIAVNIGLCPSNNGIIHPGLVNIHLNIYWYRHYFEDVIGSFHMNY